ncbi:MAG: isoprenylcysteine carboxylmethyltransferase family protein [Proteobacteria bacterium]|nr:isoprenylcysteine carboxylmethyltransferase family protein [Pseudomonadota bacterium]
MDFLTGFQPPRHKEPRRGRLRFLRNLRTVSLPGFRDTKSYDLLAASPLLAINILGAGGLLVRLADQFSSPDAAKLSGTVNAMALLAIFAFVCVQIFCLCTRKVPLRFSENLLSRVVAIASANIGLSIVLLHHVSIPPPLQMLSSALMLTGAAASTYVTVWLGDGFSILPQARALVVKGPYRFVRHPLYLSETVTTFGLMLQYAQPWALLIALLTTAILFLRMHYEERILAIQFPAYRDYAAHTPKFLPGIV